MDCSPVGKSVRRQCHLHLLLIGVSHEHVLRNARRGEHTLRLWVERFNEQGIYGLIYRPPPGLPRKLGADEVAATILPMVDDPASAGQTHWTSPSSADGSERRKTSISPTASWCATSSNTATRGVSVRSAPSRDSIGNNFWQSVHIIRTGGAWRMMHTTCPTGKPATTTSGCGPSRAIGNGSTMRSAI